MPVLADRFPETVSTRGVALPRGGCRRGWDYYRTTGRSSGPVGCSTHRHTGCLRG